MTVQANTIKEILQNYTVDPVWQRELYEELHAHPELSMQEANTHARILMELERFDCQVIAPIGGYGIVAVFHNCLLYTSPSPRDS